MNPIAVLYMKNGKKIVIELLPEAAPNTVNSFIYVASRGLWSPRHQRICPGQLDRCELHRLWQKGSPVSDSQRI